MFVQEKVTIVGGGNGGFTAAADLAVKGHRVCLFELPQFSKSLEEVKAKGGIDLETLPSSGCKSGFAKLELITSDAKEAMSFGDIVLVIVPSYGVGAMAKELAPYVEERHIIVLAPPNFGGALFFHNVLVNSGCPADIPICEFDTMPYAVRKTSPSSVWLRGFKHQLGFSCFPSSKIGNRFERCSHLYDLVLRKNELHTCLNNTNNTLHVGIMLCNVAAIENKEKKLFYRDASLRVPESWLMPCFVNAIPSIIWRALMFLRSKSFTAFGTSIREFTATLCMRSCMAGTFPVESTAGFARVSLPQRRCTLRPNSSVSVPCPIRPAASRHRYGDRFFMHCHRQ